MRILADSNVSRHVVHALRGAGHDVAYAGERETDPGDAALLAEACGQSRILLTKDHDFGELIHRRKMQHAGVLLMDELSDPVAEISLVMSACAGFSDELIGGAFVRIRNGKAKALPTLEQLD